MAILLVVLGHAGVISLAAGQVGVTLFFVLSGFLITQVLLRQESSGGIDLRSFYVRRARRLLPALGLFLLVSTILLAATVGWSIAVDSAWAPALYVTNYARASGVDVFTNPHLWSLAVEEHFYILWPLLLLAVPAVRSQRVMVAAIVVLIGWRLIAGLWVDPMWTYLATDTNAYALALGCLLGLRRSDGGLRARVPRRLPELVVASLVFLSLWPVMSGGSGAYDSELTTAIWLPVVAALLAGVAIWSCIEGRPPILESRPMRFFGRVSYGWYLWHAPLMFLAATNSTLPARLGVAVLSLAVAYVSWRFVERPILNGRTPKPAPAPSALPSSVAAKPFSG